MHRQRHQKGSLQIRKHGGKIWVFLYRDGSTQKYATLGQYSKMTKAGDGVRTRDVQLGKTAVNGKHRT